MATPVPGNVFAAMEELGVQGMRQRDDEISGNCPMHFQRLGKEDNHSSWSVHADEGYFNCFSCSYTGPFVQLVVDMLDVDWAEAVDWVRARGSVERVKRILRQDNDYIENLREIDTSQQYNEASLALFTDPPVEDCAERGLSPDSCDFYGVRWNAEKNLWITPVRDPDTGVLWGWQEKNARYFRNRPRDLKKSHTLFGLDVYDPDIGQVILVESPLDVVRLHTCGWEGGLSSYGAAVSDVQMSLILDVTDVLVVALDNDKSGDKMSETIRTRWANRMTVRYLRYDAVPGRKDVGEMTEREIDWAIDNAYSSVVARF